MSLVLDDLQARLTDSGLLSRDELREFIGSLPADPKLEQPEEFLRALVNSQRLTGYQAQQIAAGQGQRLVLGNYEVLDKLGQGGMGLVLKARHRRMERVVALKVLSPAVTRNAEALRRFQREAVAAARLVHPHIVTAFDADEAKGTHFLVMEYVDGRDLSLIVRQTGPLSLQQALRCAIQAARGLEFAHQNGVIHRDVKPSNLLLDAAGKVKVLDLGLARLDALGEAAQAELTLSGDVMGTVDYMAPEQAESARLADARSDIYSLGMSLWFMLTGRVCYQGETLSAKLVAHRTAPIPKLAAVLSDAPPQLDEIFQKLAAKDPLARYQSMTEVIAALEGLLGPAGSATRAITEENELTVRLASVAPRGEETIVFVPPSQEATHRDAAQEATLQLPFAAKEGAPRESTRRGTPLAIALAFIGGAAMILFTVWLLGPSRGGNVLVEVTDQDVELTIDQGKVKIVGAVRQKLSLKAGEHELAVKRGDTELAEKFVVAKGRGTSLLIEVVDGVLQVKQDGQVLAQVKLATKVAGAIALPANARFALEFAPGSKVEIGSLKLDRAGNLTLEAYVTTGEAPSEEAGLLLGTPLQFGLRLDPATNGLSLDSQHADGARRVGPVEIPRDRRTHVAAVRAGGVHRLYVDGVAVASADSPSPLVESDAPFTIGEKFAGSIAEVRVSNVARYEAAFTPEPRFEPDDDTLALFHVVEGAGESLIDVSRNGHLGTITAGKWVSTASSATPDAGRDAPPAAAEIVAIDLLQDLDPAKDGLVHDPADGVWKPGGWTLTPAGLRSGTARHETFRLPVKSLPPNYTVDIEFELDEGDGALLVALAVGPSLCYVAVNGDNRDGKRLAGIGDVDGIGNHRNPTTVLHPPCKLHERHTLSIDVQTARDEARLVARLDGKPLTEFYGKTQRLKIIGFQTFYDGQPTLLTVGSMLAPYLFHKVELRPLPSLAAWDQAPKAYTTQTLFDERTLEGWRGIDTEQVPPGWSIEGRMLVGAGNSTSIATQEEFDDFELNLEWKIDKGADAGVFYRWGGMFVPAGQPFGSLLFLAAPEYQMVDNENHPNGKIPKASNGAAFAVYEPAKDLSKPAGEWNSTRIVVAGQHVEHWLNGERVVEYDLQADDWKERVASMPRFSRLPEYGRSPRGRIALQTFTGKVWYRNIRLRSLSPPIVTPPPAVAPFDAAQALVHQEAWAKHLGVPVEFANSLGMKFRLIPPGEFQMGSSDEEIAAHLAQDITTWQRRDLPGEAPRRRVRISRPLYAGVHEVRVKDFRAFVNATNYQTEAETSGGGIWLTADGQWVSNAGCSWKTPGWEISDEEPAVCLTLRDADEFCRWLSGQDKRPWRVPTEAEWEHLARAGTATEFSTGAALAAQQANIANLKRQAVAVGQYPPNPFGLFDIHGNVFERCSDWYDSQYYQSGPTDDPRGPAAGRPIKGKTSTSMRGGGWYHPALVSRSAMRGWTPDRVTDHGVRIVCEVGP